MSVRLAIRVWLPDEPGTLAALANRIAEEGGNVIGLEVLEQSEGVAVDDLIIEITDRFAVESLCRRIRTIAGAGIEHVKIVPPGTEERGLQVITAAVSILETANASASLAAMVGLVGELFDAKWTALVDLRTESYIQCTGSVPPLDWLLAFLAGARSLPPDGATTGSGVMVGELTASHLAVGIGRPVPFRRREQRELEMLVQVTDRMCRPLRGDRIPPGWGPSSGFIGA
jgi:hypothetical protein